jgi:hypothetical protein
MSWRTCYNVNIFPGTDIGKMRKMSDAGKIATHCNPGAVRWHWDLDLILVTKQTNKKEIQTGILRTKYS